MIKAKSLRVKLSAGISNQAEVNSVIPRLNRTLWSQALKTRLFLRQTAVMPETHVPDSSFSPFRWGALCAKSLNPLHQQVPTESAAVSSHVHHPEEHTVQTLLSLLFRCPTSDTAPAKAAPHSSPVFPSIPALGTIQDMTHLQAGACKNQEKRRFPFWVDFRFLQKGLKTAIFILFTIRNQSTSAEGFNRSSSIRD